MLTTAYFKYNNDISNNHKISY